MQNSSTHPVRLEQLSDEELRKVSVGATCTFLVFVFLGATYGPPTTGVEMAFAGNVTVVNSSVPEHPQAQTIYGCFHGLHRSEQWIRLELRPIRKLDLFHDMPFEVLYLTMLRTVRGLTSEELEQYMARDDAGKHAMFASIGTEIMTDETDTQKEFECEAGQQLCEYRGIIELDRIEYPAYIVRTVLYSSAFSDISNPTAPEIDEIQFQLQHGTSSETTYLALFKLLSLGISYVAWMKYKDQLRRLRAASRSEEQLLLQHLLFCLMLFNDPFYVFEVLLGGSLLPIVSVMFEVTYWAMLLLFWGVAVDRTRLEAEDKRFERRDFYENKLKLCGVFWFSTVFVFCGNLEEARSDPINGTMLPTFLDKFFTLVAVVAVGVYAIWIGGIVWALYDQRELQALSRRFQYLLLVSGGLAAIACFGTIMCGYFNMLTTNMGEYTGLYSLFNIYTVLVAFLYSPAPANAHISLPERSEQPPADTMPSPNRARQLEKAAAVGAGAGGVVAMSHDDDDDDIFGASPPRAERGVSTGVPTRASPGHASASQAPVSFDQIDNSFAVGDLDDDDDDGGLDGDTEIEL